jgi:hypothetical protein
MVSRMIPNNISATNAQVRAIAEALLKISESVHSLETSLKLLDGRIELLTETTDSLVAYSAKVRDVVNLPPMFPANPSHDDYFHDEKTDSQYLYHEAQDEWEESHWWKFK